MLNSVKYLSNIQLHITEYSEFMALRVLQ